MRYILRRRLAPALLLMACALADTGTGAALAQAPGERSAVPPQDCDRACLLGHVRAYLAALSKRSPAGLPLAPDVRYTENNVELPLGGHGIWATATGIAKTGLEAADPQRGEAAWIGAVDEHGAPVYYGLRLQVRSGLITEAEAVVVRNSGLPLPWGDFTKLEHDPAFNEVLPAASRRPRERLRAVADSYFNTVELNDGVVFAPFHEDCARIENGISTTRASATAGPAGQGNASSISPGCEAQFRLGIYYINKRVRERRYPVIDEERGVVVATGFFDHANGFDRYRLTDGREMRTALKWPNSISLVEAFKIVDGKIYRIETVFSYVPYFMPNPFYLHDAAPPPPAPGPAREAGCDEACIGRLGTQVLDALAARRPQDVPWAPVVRYSENGVPMAVGDGLWASIRSRAAEGVAVADAAAGQFAWYGVMYDHDAPAYAGLRVQVQGGRVAAVEAVVARERNPGPWLKPAEFTHDAAFAAELPAAERLSRRRLVALVDSHVRALPAQDARAVTAFAADCVRRENGQPVRAAAGAAAVVAAATQDLAQPGCASGVALGLHHALGQLRSPRVVAVDESRGLVVLQSLADFPLRTTQLALADGRPGSLAVSYPLTRELFEVYRVRAGRISRVDAVSVFQPYGIATPWAAAARSARR